jgi:hypothetical protein
MRMCLARTLIAALIFSMPLLAACSDDEGGSHDVMKSGVGHRAGLENPLSNCTECHGAALRGGSGPSCYSCHSIPASHTAIRGGQSHNPGAATVCPTCHGPNNSGGLGPACSTCH